MLKLLHSILIRPEKRELTFPNPPENALPLFDKELEAFMKRWNIPGATVAVVQKGNMVYNRGYGKSDGDQKMKEDQLFRIASLSKPITSLAVMRLVEEGRLKLDDLVFGPTGLLNEAPYTELADVRMRQINVKHLLNHTAGWDRQTSSEGDPLFKNSHIACEMKVAAPAPPQTVIQYMLGKKLDFAPGARFAYSNLGYSILGRIIEKLTGQSYAQHITETILQPLGITDLFLGKSGYTGRGNNEVWYFEGMGMQWMPRTEEEKQKEKKRYHEYVMEVLDSPCGWIGSAPALAKLLTAFSESSAGQLLSAESKQRIATGSAANGKFGLGWFLHSKDDWSHTGCLPGSSAMLYRSGEGVSWVVLFNSWPDKGAYFPELERMMQRAIAKVTEWPTPVAQVLPLQTGQKLPLPAADGAASEIKAAA